MPQPGTIDINATISAWADIVIKIWHEKMVELKVYDTGELYNSLLNELVKNAGNDIDRIEFSFKLYGIFVDMGAGKYGPGRLSQRNTNWFSRIFFGQVRKLKEILTERYSSVVTETVINSLTIGFYAGYNSEISKFTATERQRIRNKKNYDRRRAQPGRWVNNSKTWKPY
ncbi:hypothetical protein [uncultured Sunxiuqinia sp.]|uniref:hypothetical protein n=1 Tax=uncultured Sunxiuqinia sp. TaxID=1573825 RepID=UPI002622A17E|nr:hypothetical protein [uncultured Sunxiuqinia sp.]